MDFVILGTVINGSTCFTADLLVSAVYKTTVLRHKRSNAHVSRHLRQNTAQRCSFWEIY